MQNKVLYTESHTMNKSKIFTEVVRNERALYLPWRDCEFLFPFRGLFFEKHLKFIKLNDKFVPFTKKDLTYLQKVG